jgi:hypothetical protein
MTWWRKRFCGGFVIEAPEKRGGRNGRCDDSNGGGVRLRCEQGFQAVIGVEAELRRGWVDEVRLRQADP